MKSHFLNLIAVVTTRVYHYWTKVDSAWCRKRLKYMENGIQDCRSAAAVAVDEDDEERVRLWLGRAEAEKKRRAEYVRTHALAFDIVEQAPLGVTGHWD